jgi:peptidoglycan-associated lipoprotein
MIAATVLGMAFALGCAEQKAVTEGTDGKTPTQGESGNKGAAGAPAQVQVQDVTPTTAPAAAPSAAPTETAAPAPAPAAPMTSAAPAATDTAPVAPAPLPKAVVGLERIHFDFDKSAITPAAADILKKDAQVLLGNPGKKVVIEGHCDERGTAEYNLALGERRAKSTMNYLVGQGVAASRITVISYGKERPVCTEKTEACWAKNRRAHHLVKAQ